MTTELTNLLPASAVRAMRRRYFVRLATVAIAMLILVLIAHGVLLLPSYVHARQLAASEQAQLDVLAHASEISKEKEADARISAIRADVTYLGRLQTSSTVSGAIKAVLAVPHAGITLTGFTYAAANGTTQAQMGITGTAATRDALREYSVALGREPYVTNADLPISAYAKETAIPFTITLTGTLKP